MPVQVRPSALNIINLVMDMDWEYLYNDFSFDIEILRKKEYHGECPFCHGENGTEEEKTTYWWGDIGHDEAGHLEYDHVGTVHHCVDCGKYFVVED